MAAKSSIRDTARVMELPLGDADRLSKQMPDISLSKLFKLDDKSLKDKLRGQEGLGPGQCHQSHPRRPRLGVRSPQESPRDRRLGAEHRHPRLRGHHHAGRHHQVRASGHSQGQRHGVHAVRQLGGRGRGPAQDGLLGIEDPDHHQGRGAQRQAAQWRGARPRGLSAGR